MQYLTLGEAEDEVGVTKSTISRAIKAGRLSATRNEHGHYQIDPAELFRVYPATSRNSDDGSERNATQQPLQQGATPQNTSTQGETVKWMMKRLDDVETKLAETEHELESKEQAYDELKEIYSALPSPESFDAKLAEEIDRVKTEAEKELALEQARQAEKEATWKNAIAERQEELKAARVEADQIRKIQTEQAEALEREAERVRALQSRGLLARLFNKPIDA